MESKQVIWLASYPKAGNTWFRSFITALLTGKADINSMATDGIFSDKSYVEETLDLEVDDLTDLELEKFRKQAFIDVHSGNEKTHFVKIHDAFTYSIWTGEPIIPTEVSKLVVYLIRNPLDIALSFANHNGQEVQETIDKFLCAEDGAMVKWNKAGTQSKQLMGTWAMHVESWITQSHIPVHVIRYEDMKSDPYATFSNAVNCMGLTYSEQQIRTAIDLSRFERLKAQEDEKGFKEKAIKASSFFHLGKVGRWKDELTLPQIKKIMNSNEKMMRKFGYFTEMDALFRIKRSNF